MVKLCNCKWDEFLYKTRGKHLFCFGSGEIAKWLSKDIFGQNIAEHIEAFVDNDLQKVNSSIKLDGIEIPIISYMDFVKNKANNSVMLVTSMYYDEIINQMDHEVALSEMECYVAVFLEEEKITVTKKELFCGKTEKIPKKIHYCWFGGKDIPSIYKSYIESWKKYCPDYEIICWNEDNYDYKKINYTKEAYEAGKWAFVSDYARLDIIYNHGGIYLDVDVQVVKNLDLLLRNSMFCGFEKGNYVNTGVGFGAVAGFSELRKMKDLYCKIPFKRKDGTLNLTACTNYQTNYLVQNGLKRNGKLQVVNGIRVYPRTVLAPTDFYDVSDYKSPETYAIHHYAASWFADDNSKSRLLKSNIQIKNRMEIR